MPAQADRARGASAASIARALGAWFDANARDLPWRRRRDPFAVWVSEVMLQQTRVATVVGYFEPFLARFPTVAALAAASEDEVLAQWSGLGYYRRARALHRGARDVVARFGGALPPTAAELVTIPGVGPYTAGAIASLAFGERAALVDGNVARVLARLLGLEADMRSPAGMREAWAAAERLLPAARAGRHNEALMELGAGVCTPRDPACAGCPLARSCVARRDDRTGELPRMGARAARSTVALVALVAHRGATVLLGKRSGAGLFGGLWEPPMCEGSGVEALAAALGLALDDARVVGRVRRVLTHRTLDVTVVAASTRGALRARAPYASLAWHDRASLGSLGVSSAARAVLAALDPPEVSPRPAPRAPRAPRPSSPAAPRRPARAATRGRSAR